MWLGDGASGVLPPCTKNGRFRRYLLCYLMQDPRVVRYDGQGRGKVARAPECLWLSSRSPVRTARAMYCEINPASRDGQDGAVGYVVYFVLDVPQLDQVSPTNKNAIPPSTRHHLLPLLHSSSIPGASLLCCSNHLQPLSHRETQRECRRPQLHHVTNTSENTETTT